MEKDLIAAVKKHDILYDKGLLLYKNKEKRAAAWNSISNELNLPENICQARWKSLRDNFVKKLGENDSTWQYQKQMEFLRDHVKPRTCRSAERSDPYKSLALINAVKSHEILYDKTLLLYRNKSRRADAWSSISSQLNLPEKVCQARWKSLRDRFVKKLAENQNVTDSEVEIAENQWEYQEHLEFLREHIKPRRTETTLISENASENTLENLANTLLKDDCNESNDSLEDNPFFEVVYCEEEPSHDVLAYKNESDSPAPEVSNRSQKIERRESVHIYKNEPDSPAPEVSIRSQKRERRESDSGHKNKMAKYEEIEETQLSTPAAKGQSSTHDGFFAMVREIFDDLPSHAIRRAKFFFLNHLHDILEETD